MYDYKVDHKDYDIYDKLSRNTTDDWLYAQDDLEHYHNDQNDQDGQDDQHA